MTKHFCDTCRKEIKRAVMPDKGKEVIITEIKQWDKIFCCGDCFIEYMKVVSSRHCSDDFCVVRRRFQMATEGEETND